MRSQKRGRGPLDERLMERSQLGDVLFAAPIDKGASDAEVIAALKLTIKLVHETLLPA